MSEHVSSALQMAGAQPGPEFCIRLPREDGSWAYLISMAGHRSTCSAIVWPDRATAQEALDWFKDHVSLQAPECFTPGFKERAAKAEVAEVPEGIETRPA